jgi:tetratricopeptide (TPR) repeat protein
MRFSVWRVSVVALFALTTSTNAQLAPEWQFCDGKGLGTPDVRITNCTTLIQSRRESQGNKAVAYSNRGNEYLAKGDNDRAIADFNEAIRLDPRYAIAYNSRGIAYSAKRDLDRAIADFNEAITLDPKFANAYNNRGLVRRAKGDASGGDADIATAKRLNPRIGN